MKNNKSANPAFILLVVITLVYNVKLIAQPTITNFSPTSGPVGTLVTITGTNFNDTVANNLVLFGTVAANIVSASSTSITANVPVGTNFQYITVTNLTSHLTAYTTIPFSVTFSCDSALFASRVDFTAGNNPYCLAIGDIDGDGKPDICATNYNSPSISVFRNISTTGTIVFAAAVNFTAYPGPWGIALGDFDGDGKLDMAVANNNSPYNISVFRNTSTPGNISFATRIDIPTGTLPYMIAVADLDGDGKPDIASPNWISSNVATFRNTSTVGNISFAAHVDFATGADPEGIAIGDIDGDGKPDMAVAGYGTSVASVFRNISTVGTINFAPKVDFTTQTNVSHIAIGDLDGDGKPDLALSSLSYNGFSALRNTSSVGSVSFAPKVDFLTGNYPEGIAMGDLDGDGKPDIVTGDLTAGSISTLHNTSIVGTLSFAAHQDYLAGVHAYGVVIGDMDGDARPDIAVANSNATTISTFLNQCPLTTSIASVSKTSELIIYPNPNNGVFDIILPEEMKNQNTIILQLSDLAGRNVFQKNLSANENTVKIDVSILPEGIYLYDLILNNSQTQHGKFVVQK